MKRTLWCFLLTGVATLASNCLAFPAFRTVALTGQPAPGMPAGTLFEELFTLGEDYYTDPQIDDQGRVAFSATFPSLWENLLYGYWSEGSGSLEMLAGSGAPPVGAPPGTDDFFMYAYPAFDHAGNSYFWGFSHGPGINFRNGIGTWAGKAGSLGVVLHGGLPAPGLPLDVLFQDGTSSPITTVSASGNVVIHGYVQGAGVDLTNSTALWVGMPNSLELLARTGEQAPGLGPGHLFTVLDPYLGINATGEVSFLGAVTNPAGSPVWKQGVWAYRGGATELVAVTGDQAPDTEAGAVFSTFGYDALIDDASHVVFTGYLSGPGVTPANREGIWRETTNGLELLVRSGDPAPGTAVGTVFDSLETFGLGLDAEGHVVFRASLVGGDATANSNEGLWRATDNSLELILREGDEAPGMAAGTYFSHAPIPTMNQLGQMAFLAYMRGNSANDRRGVGIWASDLDGLLQLIIKTGDLLEVAPGDFRTISELRMLSSLGYDAAYRAFNNRGQLTFGATFTDGTTGVFVSNRVAVPEPSGAWLAALCVGICVAQRRRARGREEVAC